MEDKILTILGDINYELLTYTGSNIVDDGIVNSLDLIMIISGLEEAFGIEIDTGEISEENFGNKDCIIKMMKRLTEK